VHRLDKDTTGLLVVAKNESVQSFLAAQFASHKAGRTYTALVLATPRARRLIQQQDQGQIETFIGRHPRERTKMAVTETGRRAVTNWRVAEKFTYAYLLEVQLETGRTHQIRVHMNHIGSPVIGDNAYGDFSPLPRPLAVAAAEFGRQALHGSKLKFIHPRSRQECEYAADLPADFLTLVAKFRSY
jgi:23S rRNA pseudouridine1911/1915/1917 synthase